MANDVTNSKSIDAIDIITFDQSVKRKNNHDTVYDLENILDRMTIQEANYSKVIEENLKLKAEIDAMKKNMTCFQQIREKEVTDIKNSIDKIKEPPLPKKKPGPKKDKLTVYNLFRQLVLHPMVNEQDAKGKLVGNKRDAVNKLVAELWSAPKAEFEIKRKTEQPQLTKAELQIEYNELMRVKYNLVQCNE